jgi:hypothetical protein
VVEECTAEHFRCEVAKAREPAVLRGLPLGPCVNLWTPEHLMQRGGAKDVSVHVSPNDRMDFITKNFKYHTLPFDELVRRAAYGCAPSRDALPDSQDCAGQLPYSMLPRSIQAASSETGQEREIIGRGTDAGCWGNASTRQTRALREMIPRKQTPRPTAARIRAHAHVQAPAPPTAPLPPPTAPWVEAPAAVQHSWNQRTQRCRTRPRTSLTPRVARQPARG